MWMHHDNLAYQRLGSRDASAAFSSDLFQGFMHLRSMFKTIEPNGKRCDLRVRRVIVLGKPHDQIRIIQEPEGIRGAGDGLIIFASYQDVGLVDALFNKGVQIALTHVVDARVDDRHL